MRADNGDLSLSPSDLTAYLACEHLARLELQVALGEVARPRGDDPQTTLIRRKGEEHERAFLERLLSDGRDVAAIDASDWDVERAARETEDAIRAGREVIYQAAFLDRAWRGFADFVVRGEDGSYEAYDTKLARHGKPAHVLQLCFYSEQIGRIQGRLPQRMHIAVGSGETETYRTDDFMAYFRRVRGRFEAFVSDPPPTEPYPVEHCSLCAFLPLCTRRWDELDHLTRVANMRRDQIVRLGDAGITTLERLGDTASATPIPRMAPSTFESLRHQAELQLRHRRTGRHSYEFLTPEEERGLALLPKPSRGDLFFDIEGDPWFEPSRGLEYLFGVIDAQRRFSAFWAHDRDEERRAFERFVDFVHERLRDDPDLHVYHYAAYEPSALKRLMSEYATREEAVDDLLRREVFVDLYAVVRQSLRISHPRYSIKNVEQFYMQREAELRAGDDSIVLYERWLDERDDSILRAIEAYNREDCLSTLMLRDWLIERKREVGAEIPWREPPEKRERKAEAVDALAEREALRDELNARGEELLALLLEYHRREAKPGWWSFFQRLELTVPELIEDAEAIGGLVPAGERDEDKYAYEYGFSFPAQQHRIDVGDSPIDPFTGKGAGTLVALGDEWLRLRRGKKIDRPLPRALIPRGPFDTSCQQAALMRFARMPARYAPLERVLRRVPPLDGARVQVSTHDQMKRLAERVEGSYLFVQGPPGSGKTFTGARLVVDLLARGKRVGVASTSHKAIHNMLDAIEEAGLGARGMKKSSTGNPESVYESAHVDSADEVDPSEDVQLYAGTAWLFARPEFDQVLDYLFIDEAGQVSLADALAMGTSARTMVLLGDPLQLAQVTQGVHPGGSGASVLEHLLGDAKTIPEDRGLFLERSFRMHPLVCRFISDAFYESRLESVAQHPCTEVGVRFMPVEHLGNRVFSPEEAEAIARALEPFRPEDVMVVAPYNEQVKWLRDHLPAGVRVGTVDKFQGQEAPVVFFSMTTSSGEDVPRNLEFLLSRNRLNVAISRARCLAYLVASPRLLEVGCRSIDQMRMANALCLFVEQAS
jgi:predicted RecB family nuclease